MKLIGIDVEEVALAVSFNGREAQKHSDKSPQRLGVSEVHRVAKCLLHLNCFPFTLFKEVPGCECQYCFGYRYCDKSARWTPL